MRTPTFSAKTKKTTIETGALILVMAAAYLFAPQVYAADTLAGEDLVFEVQSGPMLTYAELMDSHYDPLVEELRAYLIKNKSPLAEYAEEMVKLPRWEISLAVSKVESNMGIYCKDNNCSGIGVHPSHPSWRKYPSKLHWFTDMTVLMNKPMYKDRLNTCAKMRGVYVVPGSDNWVNGCNKVLRDIDKMKEIADSKRVQNIANLNSGKIQAVAISQETHLVVASK